MPFSAFLLRAVSSACCEPGQRGGGVPRVSLGEQTQGCREDKPVLAAGSPVGGGGMVMPGLSSLWLWGELGLCPPPPKAE